MQRLRLSDFRLSRGPGILGICQADLPSCANFVNSAQRRLLLCKEAGEEGWWGGWAEMAFQMSRAQPYLTLPREVARLERMMICERPIFVQNQFYEYLSFSNGRLPKTFFRNPREHCIRESFTRNNVPLFTDLTNPPQLIAVYNLDPADNGKRALIQGTDSAGNTIITQDGPQQVQGEWVTMVQPFAVSANSFSTITGIQKDVTTGAVQFQQMDPTTAATVLLLTMEASEETAWYRRYYLNGLPNSCCPPVSLTPCATPPGTVQLTAIAKLDLIPVRVDTDYLLFTNLEAIIEECQSVRYSEMDTPTAAQLADLHHRNAVRLLNGELVHFLGKELPAWEFKPFGSARLERQQIGTMI